jgi:hypothetical protein
MGVGMFKGIFNAMGVPFERRSSGLDDPYSSGGSDTYSGLSDEGNAFAKQLRGQLENPYARFKPVEGTMNLDNMGLTPGQRSGFDQAIKQAFSRSSGSSAMAGQLRPEHFSTVAGSAAQQVLPQFAPLISQNLGMQFQQGVQNNQQQYGMEADRLNKMLGVLNQYQVNTGKQRGPGMAYNATNSGTEHWFNMWDKIGSSWGGAGGFGQGAGMKGGRG